MFNFISSNSFTGHEGAVKNNTNKRGLWRLTINKSHTVFENLDKFQKK